MKHNTMQKPAFRLAFCAAVAALETVLMLLTGLVRVGTYAVPCLAGMLTVAVVLEYGCKWAFGVYGVAAVLSFFVSGDKEAVVLFALLFGYYPILKNILERHISQKVILWIVKYALFNAAAVGSFFIATKLMAVPAEEFTLFGIYMPLVFLAFGNLFFLLYDFALTTFVVFYVRKIREKLLHIFK